MEEKSISKILRINKKTFLVFIIGLIVAATVLTLLGDLSIEIFFRRTGVVEQCVKP